MVFARAETEGEEKDTASVVAQHYNMRPEVSAADRYQSPIINLKNFNNWVKSVLYANYVTEGDRVLDLGCGKGGDLLKLSKRNISHLVAVDIAAVSVDQARQRHEELRGHRMAAEFLAADCSMARLTELFSRAYEFDVVTCQFSCHYHFESEARARRFLLNVTEGLRPGGYFIGTTTDACRLVKKVRQADGLVFGNDVVKVRFERKDVFPAFGAKYFFDLVDAIDECPEYLVHFKVFESLAHEYGLQLVRRQGFHEFYVDECNRHRDLWQRMRVVDANGSISLHQWEAIGYYVAFAFRKMDDVKPNGTAPTQQDTQPAPNPQHSNHHVLNTCTWVVATNQEARCMAMVYTS